MLEEMPPARSDSRAASRPPLTVLIVDDNDDNRDLYTQYLEHRGLTVASAANALDGIALAEQLRPDLILMDLGLPGLDGWEATRRLKQTDWSAGITIVAVTAHVLEEARQRALEAGVDGFVTKPVTPDVLYETIQRLLRKARRGG